MISSGLRLLTSFGLVGGVAAFLAWNLNVSSVINLSQWRELIQHLQRQSQQRQRSAVLQANDQVILERIKAKEQLAKDVLDKRVSLPEAALRFRDISKAAPYHWDIWRQTHRRWSEQRRCCYYVILWVRDRLVAEGRDPSAIVDELTKIADQCQ